MPSVKMKTHKGTQKRFKVTATGKIIHKRCGSSHLNSHIPGKRIRRLRKPAVLNNPAVAHKLRRAMQRREAGVGRFAQIREEIAAAEALRNSATEQSLEANAPSTEQVSSEETPPTDAESSTS